MSFIGLHSTNTTLYNAAGCFALLPLSVGLYGTLNPAGAAENIFEFKLPASPDGRKIATNLILFHASRDIYMGALTAAAWWYGDRKVLGFLLAAGAGVACYDAWIQIRQAGEGAMKHLAFVPVTLGLGGTLLGWFDGF